MIQIHKAEDRGKSELDWLKSRFSFSFAEYYDSERMNFGALRVLNDDEIAPSKGFGAHPHKDMEIITIALEGEVAHKDSTGSSGVIRPGEVQVMSAGSGVVHSEFNNSKTKPAKLLQIWIQTKEKGIKPRYGQMKFDDADFKDKFRVVACGEKAKNCLYIHQDAKLSIGEFSKDKKKEYAVKKGNGLFFFMISGKANIDGKVLEKRDAAQITALELVKFSVLENSKILTIEVPMN